MFCSKCQTQNPEDSQFCINCGASLTSASVTPQDSQKTIPSQQPVQPPAEKTKSKKTLIIVLILIFCGFLVAATGTFYFLVIKIKKNTKPVPSSIFESPSVFEVPKETPPVTQRTIPAEQTPIQIVGTEFPGAKAELTSASRGGNIVTVRFTLRVSTNLSELERFGGFDYGTLIYGELVNCRESGAAKLCDKGPYSLASAYIVDETNQTKYEVMKGADGKPLASETPAKELLMGQAISLYAQFTAPPETTKTVTINFPKVQPFTGITLE